MKEYNRKTKRWEEKSTEKVGSGKKPALCKGRKPHDFVLVLPPYTRLLPGAPYLNAEQIEAYYLSEKRRKAHEVREDEYQKTLGIDVHRYRFSDEVPHYYLCANCGKRK